MDETQTTVGAVSMMAAAWSHQDFPDDAIRVYVAALRDIDAADLTDAIVHLVKTERFRPTVADIRRAVAEQRLQLPSPARAYEQAIAHATGLPRLHRAEMNEHVLATMDALGGQWTFRTTENPEVLRGQFIRAYTDRRDEAIGNVMSPPPPALPSPERLQLPATESMQERPIYLRWLRRQYGEPVDSEVLSDEVKHDAIKFLHGTWPAWSDHTAHPLYEEAMRVMDAYDASIVV